MRILHILCATCMNSKRQRFGAGRRHARSLSRVSSAPLRSILLIRHSRRTLRACPPRLRVRSKKCKRQHFSIPFSAASLDLLSYGSKAIVCIIINRPETPPQLANLRTIEVHCHPLRRRGRISFGRYLEALIITLCFFRLNTCYFLSIQNPVKFSNMLFLHRGCIFTYSFT